jgi:hypothetical protein
VEFRELIFEGLTFYGDCKIENVSIQSLDENIKSALKNLNKILKSF